VVSESQPRKQLDVIRLACPVTKQELVLELRNRFSALTDTSEETTTTLPTKGKYHQEDLCRSSYQSLGPLEEEPQRLANTGNMEKY